MTSVLNVLSYADTEDYFKYSSLILTNSGQNASFEPSSSLSKE